jgi:hypothetical protein
MLYHLILLNLLRAYLRIPPERMVENPAIFFNIMVKYYLTISLLK